MKDRYLESILESEHIEQIPENEPLQQETYDLECDDHYLLDQEQEAQNNMEKFHEMIPDMDDDYKVDHEKLEIQEAIDDFKEEPPEDIIELEIRMNLE